MGNLNRGPSPHITWNELACKDGTPYPQEYIADGTVYRLARVFDQIRAIWDKPIVIHSVYRTVSWNNKIGGTKNSQHCLGRAMDLAPPKGVGIDKFYNEIRSRCDLLGIRGIGKYRTFVHVDIRDSDRLATWSGTGVKDSRT